MIIATYTNNYKLGQFLGNSEYDPNIENIRWEAVDVNLAALSGLLGDGIISGWDVTYLDNDLNLYISPGTGIINKWSAETTLDNTFSLAGADAGTDYYLYAYNDPTQSYYNKLTLFDIGETLPDTAVALARFQTDELGVATIDISYNIRRYCGIDAAALAFINNHVHDGLSNTNSAAKINLTTDVTGLLSADNIGNISASKIIGEIPANKIAPIPHNSLIDSGKYSHDQIDDFIETIDYQTIGEVALANEIQSNITLAHALGKNSLSYLINEKVIIPGVTASYDIDAANSSIATINLTDHIMVGTTAATTTPYISTRMWSGKYDTYGFLNTANEYSNVDMSLKSSDGSYYLHLKKDSQIDKYYSSGYLQIDFNANLIVNFESLVVNSLQAASTSLYLKYQTANELVFKDSNYSSPIQILPTTNYSVDLTNLNPNRYIRMRFDLNSSSDALSSPILNSIALAYNTSVNSQTGYKKFDSKTDYDSNLATYSNIDTFTSPGNVTLKKYTDYSSYGYFMSTYIDGATTLVRWNKLYTDYYKPDGTNIEWSCRSATVATALPSTSWSYPTSVNGLYDISTQKNRYIQVKANLSMASYSVTTPEILEVVLTGINEIPTYASTAMYYNRWSLSGSGDEGFGNYSYIDNVTASYYGNALTVDDKNQETSIWRSNWKKLDNNWRQLSKLYVYGENFSSDNFALKVKVSTNPVNSTIDEISMLGTTSPMEVDLSGYTTGSFSTTRDLYIQVETTLKSNIG